MQGVSQSDASRRRSYPGIGTIRSALSETTSRAYHEVETRPRRSGGRRTSIAVCHADGSGPGQDERLLVRAWCEDGNRPFERVDSTARYSGGQGVPAECAIVGLTRPTPAFRPLESGAGDWRMLGACQRTFQDLLDLRLLRATLIQLHWDEGPGNRALLEGIGSVDCHSTMLLRQGVALPKYDISIRMRLDGCLTGAWGAIGKIDAFAEALHRLFRGAAPRDVAVESRLVVDPAGIVLEHGR